MTVRAARSDRGDSAHVQQHSGSEDNDGTARSQETPLPWARLLVLICVRLSEPINATLIQPFMVASFKVAKDPKDIGFYAALLFSSFSICQTMTVMHWGRLSDRVGRRPVLMVGLFGYLVSFLLFGFSKSFAWALAARCLNGLLAGNVAVIKSAFAEISDDTNRARIMALIPLIWNVGSAAGAAVGGIFADPVHQYPQWFGGSQLFSAFPYLLPCLIGCSVTAFGLAMGTFMLEETLVRKPAPRQVAVPSIGQQSSSAAAVETTRLLPVDGQRQRTLRELLTPTVVRVMATNVAMYLAMAMSNQAYPIFAATAVADGGLGLTSRNIGYSLAFSAAAIMYLQLVTYPKLERQYGLLKCYQVGLKLLIPTYLALPFLSMIATGVDQSLHTLSLSALESGPWSAATVRYYTMWTLLVALLLVRSAGSVFVNTSINLLAVNLAPTKADLGSMNGVQQLGSSSTRFLGPVISGVTWSWSIKHGFPYPLNAHLVWVLCAALAAASLKMSAAIPASVNVFQAGRVGENDAEDP
ncbi:hypothetical protein LPJ61_000347 [Coemansia biformis]|uniref:Major facilitator superfamily (MFS) profile domain-containing protein n=1 Tax=Coemansia biformis TaxID=1286918 RepID=A0A9W7YIH6_9FUNG|nr:hypothetical protein LPJ61_000347 [Coemansia biformis]